MSTAGTILIVAADGVFKQTVHDTLLADGHVLVDAASAADALDEYVRAAPDLVLFDIELPGSDGLEACRTLVDQYAEDCAPVVFFSSTATPMDIAAGFGAGATDYLTKTSPPDEVRARVQAYLRNYVLLKQQKAMAEQLARANAAKNRFIGMAAHDMRNPLVSIRGFAEFLMDGTVGTMPAVQLALVTIIHGTSNLMIKTLNELLDVAAIEAGQLQLQVATHNLSELVAKSVAQAKMDARKKRTRIEFEAPAATPALTIDADKLKQVVDNLLSNAIKFSPAATVVTVTIDYATDGTSCSFSVRDQGPGMPAQVRRKVLKEPLAPEDGDTAEASSAGLGLIIIRNIIEAHQGRVAVTNFPTGGCEVRVTLPLQTAQRQAA